MGRPPQLLRVTWYFLRPFRGLCAGILAVTLAASFLEGLNLAVFLPLFQMLLDPQAQGAAGRLPSALMAFSHRLPLLDPLVSAAVVILLVIACKALVLWLREALVAQGSGRVLYDVKQRLMQRYGQSPYQFFVDTKQGTLLHSCVMAPHKVAVLALRFPQVVAELLNAVVILALLAVIWPAATVGLLLVVLAYHAATRWLSRRVSYLTGQGRRESDAEQVTVSQEFFSGIRHLMVFRTIGHWLERFRQANRRYTALYIQDTMWLALPRQVMEVTVMALLVAVVLLLRMAGPGVLTAKLPLLGVFTLALMRLIPSVTSVGRGRMEMTSLLADAEQIHAELTARPALRHDGARRFEGLRAAILFEQVSFAHQGREELLSQLNLTVSRGQTTAIVGPSGSGKSTLINLLLGLFEPTQGRITVDGVPLQAYERASWLSRIGFVSQDPFIFHATVAENILCGRSSYAREQVAQAARIAHAHDFIMELPQGYETLVGERGMKLSGGQQQRLAIARAMLGDPELLIFDEATSHLDTTAERQVQTAIEEVSRDRTVLLIAHRLSTVRQADKIVVLDEGRIVEEGSHQALLKERGRYHRLVTAGEP